LAHSFGDQGIGASDRDEGAICIAAGAPYDVAG
jgi:hypothetical protein